MANETGTNIVVGGSRQSGTSATTGEPFRPDSDLNIRVVGGIDEMVKIGEKASSIPDVQHSPMTVRESIDEAVEKGELVVKPKEN